VIAANVNGASVPSKIISEHVVVLAARGIPLELAAAAGLESADATVAGKLLGRDQPCTSGGLAIPYSGTHPTYWRVRMDRGDVRYLCPKARPVPVYRPPPFDATCSDDLKDVLVVVEAPVKALSMAAAGLSSVGLGGVATTLQDGKLHPSWGDVRGRDVRILFDANRATNEHVRAAESRLASALERAGATVRVCSLPTTEAGEDQGPDDYFAGRGAEALHDVVRAAVHTSPWIERIVEDPDELLEVLASRFHLTFPPGTRFGAPGSAWAR
jgi:Domain of unknown function (DUF3854)